MKKLLAVLLCLPLLVASNAGAASHLDGLTLIVVDAPDITALHAARNLVESKGGRVGVMVPPSVLIGWVDPAAAAGLAGAPGIREIHWTEAPLSSHLLADEQTESAVRSFNAIVSGEYERARRAEMAEAGESPQTSGQHRIPDGLTPPDIDVPDVIANLDNAGIDAGVRRSLGLTSETSVLGNSDAMTGTVAVTIFMVESDGTGTDPNAYTWTLDDMQKYANSAVVGLLWWAQRAGGHRDCWVTFLLNYHSAFDPRCQQWVEPSLHTANFVSFWAGNVMTNFGYTSGSHFSKVGAFNTWQRTTYQTNRAYSAFIAYNPPGAPSAFTDGGYAFAWLYGPYFWSLFRTTGWTRDVVVSHESGHIFGACDEYADGCSSCTSSCDLQGTPNANCETCNPDSRACMMRSNENSLCQYTKSMVGWDVLTPCAPAPPAPLAAPAISGASPGEGQQGVDVNVTVTGSNFVAGVKVDLGPGVFVHETVLVSPTTLTVWASVLNSATIGPVDVVVRNRDGQSATLAGGFQILATRRHYYAPTGGNQFPYITPATAGTSLADVIGAAAGGDSVLVPTMTFSDFQIVISKGVVLQGAWNAGFTARNLATGKTVLNLAGMVDFVTTASGGGLDGFVLENGDGRFDIYPFSAQFAGAVRVLNATVLLANCEIRNSSPQPSSSTGYGGAVYAYQSAVTITNCYIHDNAATRGGALYLDQCSGSITNTTITGNQAIASGSAQAEGSGVYLAGCNNVTITNCTIERNTGGQNGGGVFAENGTGVTITGSSFKYNSAGYGGGAIELKSTPGTIAGTRIARNTALVGGGLWITGGSAATVRNCSFEWNSANFGAGLLADGTTLSVDHNLFLGNTASSLIGGAGISNVATGSVSGNTFDRNAAASGAAGLSISSCTAPVFNNIVVNSSGVGIACSGAAPSYFGNNNVWNSSAADYTGCGAGPGSISESPLFADTASGDYHLAVHSPCIDRGRPDPAYNDPDGSRGDMGRYGSHAFTMDQPAYPKNLEAVKILPGGNAPATLITLRWDSSPEPDVTQYAVYNGTTTGFTPGASSFVGFVAAPDTFFNIDITDTLYYRVSAVDASGYGSGYSNEVCASPATAAGGTPGPLATVLYPNVPNPFNPATTIRFDVAATERVRLAVYDVAGRRVATLVDGVRPQGAYDVSWDGTDSRGNRLASGVYFYRLTTATLTQTRKMVLLK